MAGATPPHQRLALPPDPAGAAAPPLTLVDDPTLPPFQAVPVKPGEPTPPHRPQPGELTNHALRWLYEHRDRRFFLWVHFLRPHAPYRARPEAAHLYRPGYEGPFAESSGNFFAADRAAETGKPVKLPLER